MLAGEHKKRRMKLLKDLASRCKGRHDARLPLAELVPTLDLCGFAGGTKFVEKANPVFDGGSDLAYDYNTLREEEFIKLASLTSHQSGPDGSPITEPGLTVTAKGYQALSDASKSWLRKAFEQQPVTFLQIGVNVIVWLIGLGVGWYMAPAVKEATKPGAVSEHQPRMPYVVDGNRGD